MGRRRMTFTSEKIAVFTPMPRARMPTAMPVNPRSLRSRLRLKTTSLLMLIEKSPVFMGTRAPEAKFRSSSF